MLVPFWGMAGGVIKILDYANHAVLGGVREVVLWAPPVPPDEHPIHSLPVFVSLRNSSEVTIKPLHELTFDRDREPWVLFTEPTHHPLIEAAAHGPLHQRLIHLVQGTRHANPVWSDGRNYRLLHRPMTRIVVTEQVEREVAAHVNDRYPLRTIIEGHDGAYFAAGAPERQSARSVFRVLYATWKSDLGDRVAEILADDPSFSFDAIRGECGWPELRRRYHAADLFVCSPGPQEGFYLPGIEAMAAGCSVVSAFVGGNESYLDDGANAVRAEYDDAASHARALVALAGDHDLRQTLLAGGHATVERHRLDRERRAFLDTLSTLAKPTHAQS